MRQTSLSLLLGAATTRHSCSASSLDCSLYGLSFCSLGCGPPCPFAFVVVVGSVVVLFVVDLFDPLLAVALLVQCTVARLTLGLVFDF